MFRFAALLVPQCLIASNSVQPDIDDTDEFGIPNNFDVEEEVEKLNPEEPSQEEYVGSDFANGLSMSPTEALATAVSGNDYITAHDLIKKGPGLGSLDLDYRYSNQDTLLMRAVRNQHQNMIKLLIEARVNPYATRSNINALELAQKLQSVKSIQTDIGRHMETFSRYTKPQTPHVHNHLLSKRRSAENTHSNIVPDPLCLREITARAKKHKGDATMQKAHQIALTPPNNVVTTARALTSQTPFLSS
jgi:hypothetical protein